MKTKSITRQVATFFLVAGFLTASLARAQTMVHTVGTGDTVPEVSFETVLNHPAGPASLSMFRKSLLLVEFWDIYCGSCIAGMPKLQQLQAAFAGDIQVLLVTKNSLEDVAALRQRNERVRNCTLPMVVGDTALSSLLRYQTVPTFAWINGEGVLTHFTSQTKFLNENGISRYLRGDQLDMATKTEYGDFNKNESLLTEGEGRNVPRLKYYSLISERVDFDQSHKTITRDSAGNPNGVYYLNQTMLDLYLSIYSDILPPTGFPILENRIIVEDTLSSRYYKYKTTNHYQWKQNNTFCYEARLPLDRFALLSDIMEKDITNFFGFSATVEDRERSYMVLAPLGDANCAAMMESRGGNRVMRVSPDSLYLRNSSFDTFLSSLYQLFCLKESMVPILIDESGISKDFRVDARLKGDLLDLEVLNAELSRYGLALLWQRKELPMLVLQKADPDG